MPELPIDCSATCRITSAHIASGNRRVSASQFLVLNRKYSPKAHPITNTAARIAGPEPWKIWIASGVDGSL